jgi:transposase-like protein
MSAGIVVGVDPEVTAKARRRSFTAEYKKRILAAADKAAEAGETGALLRREGLYSSTLTRWRRERDEAVQNAFRGKRGPQPERNPLSAENEKLRRRNQHLEEELRKAQIIIEVQKKVGALLAPGNRATLEPGNS